MSSIISMTIRFILDVRSLIIVDYMRGAGLPSRLSIIRNSGPLTAVARRSVEGA